MTNTENIHLGPNEIIVSKNKDIKITMTLGSCIGIVIYNNNPKNFIIGAAHIFTPESAIRLLNVINNLFIRNKEIETTYIKNQDIYSEIIDKIEASPVKKNTELKLKAFITGGGKQFQSPIETGLKNYEITIKYLTEVMNLKKTDLEEEKVKLNKAVYFEGLIRCYNNLVLPEFNVKEISSRIKTTKEKVDERNNDVKKKTL